MDVIAVALIGLLGSGETGVAQERQPRLEAILKGYDQFRATTGEMHYRYTRTDNDSVFNTQTIVRGQVWVKRPVLVRYEEWDNEGKWRFAIVITARATRQCVRLREETVVVPVTKDGDTFFLHGLLRSLVSTLAGPPSDAVVAQCKIRLLKEDDKGIHLELKPRTKEARADFEEFRVLLDKDSYRVRQVQIVQPNANGCTWDFEAPTTHLAQPITEEGLTKDLPKKEIRIDPTISIPPPPWLQKPSR